MLLSTAMGSYYKYFSFEESVDLLLSAGFDAIDFSFDGMRGGQFCKEEFPESEFVNLKKYADEKGMLFNQAHAPFPSSVIELERNEELFSGIVRSMKRASILGIKNIVVHPMQHLKYADPGVPEQLFEMNMDFYNRLKPYAEEYNIKIALENMWQSKNFVNGNKIIDSTCSKPEEFIKYLDELKGECFVACLDLGHAMLVNQDVAEFIRALGHDRLKALHVHDTNGIQDSHTLPFYGGMGYWDRITKAQGDINYDGDFTYEAGNFLNAVPKELYPQATKYMAEVGKYLIEQCK